MLCFIREVHNRSISNAKKYPSNINVENMQAILMYELDFNSVHKIIFKGKIIPNLEVSNTTPKEIIIRRKS